MKTSCHSQSPNILQGYLKELTQAENIKHTTSLPWKWQLTCRIAPPNLSRVKEVKWMSKPSRWRILDTKQKSTCNPSHARNHCLITSIKAEALMMLSILVSCSKSPVDNRILNQTRISISNRSPKQCLGVLKLIKYHRVEKPMTNRIL